MTLVLASGVPCWLCGELLHLAANGATDSYEWLGESGSRFGLDADLRNLRPDPDGRLAWLRAELNRKVPARSERTWLYHTRAREYSALLVRLHTGTHHEHQAPSGTVGITGAGEIPACCGWPMHLRPSGWHCRQGCGRSQVLASEATTEAQEAQ